MRRQFQFFSHSLLPPIEAISIAVLVPLIASATTLRTVALTGQTAVGTSGGVVYSALFTPSLNNSGQVAFGGTLSGVGIDSTNDSGAWSEGGGSLALIARSGDAAPGYPSGNVLGSVSPGRINNLGQTLVAAGLVGPGGAPPQIGYWLHDSNGTQFIVRQGDQAAGLPAGVTYKHLWTSAHNNLGEILLNATLDGPGVDGSNFIAIWTAAPGNVQLVARLGDQAPDLPSGITYEHFDQPEPIVMNDSGQTVFYAGLNGPGVTSANNRGIFLGTAGDIRLVAREGSPIVGLPAGTNFGAIYEPVINSAGQIAFYAGYSDSSSGGAGYYLGTPGNFSLVARSGDQAPGAPAGVAYGARGGTVINDQGLLAFHSFLQGNGVSIDNNEALFVQDANGVKMIARRGNPAPGMPAGVTINSLGTIPAMNCRGQIAFIAQARNAANPLQRIDGIWATDATGALQLILRTAEVLEVGPGDFRTVSHFSFVDGNGNADGRQSMLNDQGQIAFQATFTDGTSGIFVSNLVANLTPDAVPGDYNADRAVDAADYTIWRDTLGTTTDLRANGDDSGASNNLVDEADYDVWKQHFGNVGGAGASGIRALPIPEPPAAVQFFGFLLLATQLRRLWFN